MACEMVGAAVVRRISANAARVAASAGCVAKNVSSVLPAEPCFASMVSSVSELSIMILRCVGFVVLLVAVLWPQCEIAGRAMSLLGSKSVSRKLPI